jgi:hypothetical protein
MECLIYACNHGCEWVKPWDDDEEDDDEEEEDNDET